MPLRSKSIFNDIGFRARPSQQPRVQPGFQGFTAFVLAEKDAFKYRGTNRWRVIIRSILDTRANQSE